MLVPALSERIIAPEFTDPNPKSHMSNSLETLLSTAILRILRPLSGRCRDSLWPTKLRPFVFDRCIKASWILFYSLPEISDQVWLKNR